MDGIWDPSGKLPTLTHDSSLTHMHVYLLSDLDSAWVLLSRFSDVLIVLLKPRCLFLTILPVGQEYEPTWKLYSDQEPHHGVQGWNECENNAEALQLTRHDAQMRHIGCSSVYCSMSTKITLYMKLSNLHLPIPATRMCLYWQFQNCLVPGGHPILLYWVYVYQ